MSFSERFSLRNVRRLLRLAAAALLCAAPPLPAAEFVLVTAARGTPFEMRRETAEQLYLGRRSTAEDGRQLQLIDLPSGPARDRFYQLLTGKNASQIRAYWSRLVFTGRALPPREAEDAEAVRRLLIQIPNSIGYLSSQDAAEPGLRVLLRID